MRVSTLLAALMVVGWAGPASADLAVLATGRVLSVKSVVFESDRAVLNLRNGGQIACEVGLVVRVDPDEVPWPEPEAESAAVVDANTSDGGPFPYDNLIEPLARRHGVDVALIRAVVATESAFQIRARSPKGAMGLMQLMPETARQYDVQDPYDPGANLEAGIKHLKSLLGRYDIRLALAAYNAGEAVVKRHGGVPPFRETRDYVDRVLRRLKEYGGRGDAPTRAATPRPAIASPTS